jgi:S-adenosylmethionine:tRNA ribosyltransferase-isomerase
MVVNTTSGSIDHCAIRDLPQLLNSGDRLVSNDTQVVPARLFGFRTLTGGRWEGLYLQDQPDGRWKITGQTRGKLQPGESLTIYPAHLFQGSEQADLQHTANSLVLKLQERTGDGGWLASPDSDRDSLSLLTEFGTLPLPPYIGRKLADEEDRDRYQTVFASNPGAIAAPTAGLHFTDELLTECDSQGIDHSRVTLHVGIGTFRPVATQKLSEHQMHSEWCRIPQQTAEEIAATKQSGGRIVAVGTTSVRTLEAGTVEGRLAEWSGTTDLFIRPGFQFQTVDALLTNFHLPGSTLLVLIAALAGYDLVMEAYQQAVQNRYRFYSYGDAMLIL